MRFLNTLRIRLLKHDEFIIKNQTPVIFAAKSGYSKILTYLKEILKLNLNEITFEGLNLLDISTREGHLEAIKYLVEQCGFSIKQQLEAMLFAVSKKHHPIVNYFLSERNLTPNHIYKNKESLLHRISGDYQMANLLINAGAKLDVINKDGDTILHVAIIHNQPETIKLFVNNMSINIINQKDKCGHTALTYAIRANFYSHIGLLLEKKAIANDDDLYHIYNLSKQHEFLFKICLEKGYFNTTAKLYEGLSPIEFAATYCFKLTIEYLLTKPEITSKQREKALTIALKDIRSFSIAELLLKYGTCIPSTFSEKKINTHYIADITCSLEQAEIIYQIAQRYKSKLIFLSNINARFKNNTSARDNYLSDIKTRVINHLDPTKPNPEADQAINNEWKAFLNIDHWINKMNIIINSHNKVLPRLQAGFDEMFETVYRHYHDSKNADATLVFLHNQCEASCNQYPELEKLGFRRLDFFNKKPMKYWLTQLLQKLKNELKLEDKNYHTNLKL